MKLKKIVKEIFEITTSLFIGVVALTNFVLFTLSIFFSSINFLFHKSFINIANKFLMESFKSIY